MVIFNCLHWLVTRFWYFPNCLYIITNNQKKVFEGNQAKTPSEGNNGGNGSKDSQNWFLVLFLIMKECCCSVLLRHCNTYKTYFFHISEYKYHSAKIRVCGTIASMPKNVENMLLCKVRDELIRREKES